MTPLIQDFLRYLKTVVQVQNETGSTGGYAPLSWSGLRHMLSEVISSLPLLTILITIPFPSPFFLFSYPSLYSPLHVC